MKERTFYKFAGRVMKVEYILGVLISNILYFWHPFCFLSCNLGERICIINRVSTLYNINESIFSCSLLAMFTTKNQVIDKVNHLMGTLITSLSMYNYQWNIPCKEGTKSINYEAYTCRQTIYGFDNVPLCWCAAIFKVLTHLTYLDSSMKGIWIWVKQRAET